MFSYIAFILYYALSSFVFYTLLVFTSKQINNVSVISKSMKCKWNNKFLSVFTINFLVIKAIDYY